MKILTKGEYYGHQNKAKSYDGVLLSHYTYSEIQTDWHYHENPYFMYVLQGYMKDCNVRQKTLCPAGSLMFTNWQEVHYGSLHSDEASGFHLEFEKSWLEKHSVGLDLWEGSQLIENPSIHLLMAKVFQEFILSDSFSTVSIEVLLLQICENLGNHNRNQLNKPPPWIGRLIEILHREEHPLNLQYLADQLNVHPVHISRAAPKYLNMNLGTYIRRQKLRRAIPLLLNPSKSLTEIAYQAGFADQSHFNRVFKAFFKMNPSTFRKIKKGYLC